MANKDEKQAVADIFKNEDFDYLNADSDYSEEELDGVLAELADLKRTISGVTTSSRTESPYKQIPTYSQTEGVTQSYEKQSFSQMGTQTQKIEPVSQWMGTDRYEQTYMPTSMRNDVKRSEFDAVLGELADIKSAIISGSKTEYNQTGIGAGIKETEEAIKELKDSMTVSESPDLLPIIRQIVSLKKLVGSSNSAEGKLSIELDELYKQCLRAEIYVKNEEILPDKKLKAIDELVEGLRKAYNYDIELLIEKANDLYFAVSQTSVNAKTFPAFIEYLKENGLDGRLTVARKEIEQYVNFCTLIEQKGFEFFINSIPAIIERKNSICNFEDSELLESMKVEAESLYKAMKTEKSKEVAIHLKKRLSELAIKICSITLSDVYVFDKVNISKEYRVLTSPESKTLFECLNELKAMISGAKEGDNDGVAILSTSSNADYLKEQIDKLYDDVKILINRIETSINENLVTLNDNLVLVAEKLDVKTIEQNGTSVLQEEKTENGQTNATSASDKLDQIIEKLDQFQQNKEQSQPNQSATFVPVIDASSSQNADGVSSIGEDVTFIKEFLLEKFNSKNDENLKSEIESLREDLKAKSQENDVLRQELVEIKNAILGALKPDCEQISISESVSSIKQELALAIKENEVDPVDDFDIDDILGRIDEAIADKNK